MHSRDKLTTKIGCAIKVRQLIGANIIGIPFKMCNLIMCADLILICRSEYVQIFHLILASKGEI